VSPHLELYLFSSGTITLNDVEVPVPFFLIRHPQGDVVVDGGNPLAVARDYRAHWGPLATMFKARMTEEQHCVAQLGQIGAGPQSVSHVVQTHLHMDHTGALGHFPDATVVVQARELEAARAEPAPIGAGYIHADYDRPELRWQTVEGELDLFGDGTIRLIETPGHTAGHTSILITLEETGPVLVTADAVDNHDQWEGRLSPRGFFRASSLLARASACARWPARPARCWCSGTIPRTGHSTFTRLRATRSADVRATRQRSVAAAQLEEGAVLAACLLVLVKEAEALLVELPEPLVPGDVLE
jgi:N-acyl homoserine lactone hydrolase